MLLMLVALAIAIAVAVEMQQGSLSSKIGLTLADMGGGGGQGGCFVRAHLNQSHSEYKYKNTLNCSNTNVSGQCTLVLPRNFECQHFI